jgi:uncharacterized membrane protein YkoI
VGRTWCRLTAVLLALALTPAPGWAAESAGTARAAEPLSREQAVTLVQRRYAARVVRTELSEQGGRRIYVFRLLSGDGKIWTVRIDAYSGAEVALP